MCFGASTSAQAVVRSGQDTIGDAVIRRLDANADGPVDPVMHRLPDIVSYTIGLWQPTQPNVDLFVGTFMSTGEFFRLDIVFNGLVNPPGNSGCCGFGYEPFLYGNHPVFGYVEIDMDQKVGTGGELDLPRFTYLGNAARFGGLPNEPRFHGRAARDETAFDGNIATPPLVDRSGEEFHIAFQGWLIESIKPSHTDNMIFDPGETWVMTGRLFPRAHGYEDFSFACCHGNSGSYEPVVSIQFAHHLGVDKTTVSLVYQLTNTASAALVGTDVVEDPDGDASNQNSVLEGLDDLVFGATFPLEHWLTDPNFVIIEQWAMLDLWPGAKNVTQFLNPLGWNINIIVGTSYAVANNDGHFVWTDLMPNVVAGDFNGDGLVSWVDLVLFNKFLVANDGQASVDDDGMVNCVVDIVNFGPNFSVFDVNYDGFVDGSDRPILPAGSPAPGDFDQDGDVDQTDFGEFQACMGGSDTAPLGNQCKQADLDLDRDVDKDDFNVFRACMSGAAVQAEPMCWESAAGTCTSDWNSRSTR